MEKHNISNNKKFSKIKNHEELLSHGYKEGRLALLSVADRTLEKLDSGVIIKNLLRLEGDSLICGHQIFDLNKYKRIYTFSSGKAANHIARAFEEVLGEHLTMGITIIKVKEQIDIDSLKKTEIYVGGHPLPNEEGIEGCKRMIEIADQMDEDDLLLLGLTGGCSSLMGYPVEGVSLEDFKEATDVMLKSSMWVMDINDIRGHLSRMSRGRLGQHIKGAKILCFEIWDAVGLDIKDRFYPVPIMGTPVGYDTVTFEDIRKIIKKYNIEEKLPTSVFRYLWESGSEEETPQKLENDVDYYILNTLEDSAIAAKEACDELGIPAYVFTTYASGESREYGTIMGTLAREEETNNRPFKTPCVIISVGETTTSIEESSKIKGHGGPSQEMVVGFALEAENLKRSVLYSMDSEGTDGTCEYAGGITDYSTYENAQTMGIDMRKALKEHSTHEALKSLGDCVYTGNTGTNLCDLNLLYIGGKD